MGFMMVYGSGFRVGATVTMRLLKGRLRVKIGVPRVV